MRVAEAAQRLRGGADESRPLCKLFCMVVLIAASGAGCGAEHAPVADQQAQRDGQSAKPATAAEKRSSSRVASGSIVATALTSHIPVYRTPNARSPFLRLANPTASGAPLVFLVRERRGGWERVYLPIRPNGATGWVNDRYVSLARNPYSLQVRLDRHELIVRKHGRVIQRIPAAVGRSVLPTPTGRYYIVELLKQPDPTGPYGPYAFGLSAFSRVLYSFGGGPGQIGIHGTDDAASIGRNRSHGCIRISNTAIARLASHLPLGTPVDIRD
jgi:lipoprotein-anchoring transpeptidase ErfK/SrfK